MRSVGLDETNRQDDRQSACALDHGRDLAGGDVQPARAVERLGAHRSATQRSGVRKRCKHDAAHHLPTVQPKLDQRSVSRLRHKGQIHDGLHSAIIDPETWDRVQQRLESQTQTRRKSRPDDHSFLAAKLYDDRGHRMSASHASKGGRRWRYYVSRAALTGRKQDAGSIVRVPAASEIENRITRAVGTHLAVQAAIHRQAGSGSTPHDHHRASRLEPPIAFAPTRAPEQEADVLTRSSVLPDRRARARAAHPRDRTRSSSSFPPPRLRATGPRGDTREPSAILKSP